MDMDMAMSGFLVFLRQNVADPENRVSGSYWVDASWIDERFRLYGWPQISVFEVRSYGEKKYDVKQVYFPTLQIDIFASSSEQKQEIADDVKGSILDGRGVIWGSGLNIDLLGGEADAVEDERVPQKAFRKTLMYQTVVDPNRFNYRFPIRFA